MDTTLENGLNIFENIRSSYWHYIKKRVSYRNFIHSLIPSTTGAVTGIWGRSVGMQLCWGDLALSFWSTPWRCRTISTSASPASLPPHLPSPSVPSLYCSLQGGFWEAVMLYAWRDWTMSPSVVWLSPVVVSGAPQVCWPGSSHSHWSCV